MFRGRPDSSESWGQEIASTGQEAIILIVVYFTTIVCKITRIRLEVEVMILLYAQ